MRPRSSATPPPPGEGGGGGGSCSDGTLLREPNGTIAVVAGGAAYYFISMDELNAAGYGGRSYISVPQGYIATMPAQPVDGTLVRNPSDGGSIAVVAGGAKFSFSSMDELNAAGYGGRPFVNLPNRAFTSITTTPGNGVLIRRPDGSIAVVAGGAKFAFASMDELNAAGYGSTQFLNIGTSAFNGVTTTAKDGTLVRAEGESGVWRITAGQRVLATAQAGETVTTLPLGAFRAIPQA